MAGSIGGLVAAVFTPMRADGELAPDLTGPVVEHLVRQRLGGLFVCGSTGEGPSLTNDERRTIAAAYVEATAGRLPVIVHVGHTCIADARRLAREAQSDGADAIAALPPYYYRPIGIDCLVDALASIAEAAPELPLFYYHIPAITQVHVDVAALLERAADRVPTLVGVKFSSVAVDELQRCLAVRDRRFRMLYGADEMLLAGLAAGAHGAVGSTYNFAAPLYHEVMDALGRGDLEAAQRSQQRAVQVIEAILRHPAQPALKATMALAGVDCGPPRAPLRPLDGRARETLQRDLEMIGFLPAAAAGTSVNP